MDWRLISPLLFNRRRWLWAGIIVSGLLALTDKEYSVGVFTLALTMSMLVFVAYGEMWREIRMLPVASCTVQQTLWVLAALLPVLVIIAGSLVAGVIGHSLPIEILRGTVVRVGFYLFALSSFSLLLVMDRHPPMQSGGIIVAIVSRVLGFIYFGFMWICLAHRAPANWALAVSVSVAGVVLTVFAYLFTQKLAEPKTQVKSAAPFRAFSVNRGQVLADSRPYARSSNLLFFAWSPLLGTFFLVVFIAFADQQASSEDLGLFVLAFLIFIPLVVVGHGLALRPMLKVLVALPISKSRLTAVCVLYSFVVLIAPAILALILNELGFLPISWTRDRIIAATALGLGITVLANALLLDYDDFSRGAIIEVPAFLLILAVTGVVFSAAGYLWPSDEALPLAMGVPTGILLLSAGVILTWRVLSYSSNPYRGRSKVVDFFAVQRR